MTRNVTPVAIAAADPIGDPAHLTGRIDGFHGGVLTGSATSTDHELPTKLLVATAGRTIGEAAIAWAPSPTTGVGDDATHDGTWSFDAKDLPPELLLEDRITFTIRSADQSVPLHSTDIVSSQFPTIADLAPGASRLGGYVDGTENDIVRGWVWDPTEPLRRVRIALFIHGRFCGTYIADQWRSDLEASGRGDGRYGFAIPARSFFERETAARDARVVTLAPLVWEVPAAPHLRYRPWRFAIPRFRDAAQTTRDLVTILTSAESFPKKVHVIDRSVRRIPDAFSAEYVHLAIEFLRIEMLKVPPRPSATLRERLVSWWRERVIRRQIHRLASLATAIAASQSLTRGEPHGAPDARSSHEQP